MAGMAGVLFAGLVGHIVPEQFDLTLSLMVLAAVVIGGRWGLLGVVGGALLVAFYDRVLVDAVSAGLRALGGLVGSPLLPGPTCEATTSSSSGCCFTWQASSRVDGHGLRGPSGGRAWTSCAHRPPDAGRGWTPSARTCSAHDGMVWRGTGVANGGICAVKRGHFVVECGPGGWGHSEGWAGRLGSFLHFSLFCG